jgi:tRNA (guanine37-N1)-methyltransferase
MHIDIISVQPDIFSGPFTTSILARAQQKQKVTLEVHDLREFGIGNYKQVDDYPYGGGAGMVLMPDPLSRCIEKLKAQRAYDDIIYLTPDGQPLRQPLVNRLSLANHLLLICGHYKGIDERIRSLYVTREISIGDYVLTGGELAAAVLTDAIVRLLPGVISDETSALTDSFQDGLLSPPVYTRPSDFMGIKVPDILIGGNEKAIADWRFDQAMLRTREKRPDLLDASDTIN